MALRSRKYFRSTDVKDASKEASKKITDDGRLPAVNLFIVVAVVSVAGMFGCNSLYSLWKTSRVYTPFPGSKVVDVTRDDEQVNEMLWGTYRSHLYFGTRTRTPESLLFGFLWFAQYPQDGQLKIRYTCEQGDGLARYGWLAHDGRRFGTQEIVDDDFVLTTDFLKRASKVHGGDWSARFKGKARFRKDTYQAVSLMFAVSNEGPGKLHRIVQNGRLHEIHGRNPVLGEFRITFLNPAGRVKHTSYLSSYVSDIYDAKKNIIDKLRYVQGKGRQNSDMILGLPGDVPIEDGSNPNFFVHQVTLELPFLMDVTFESVVDVPLPSLSGDAFLAGLRQAREVFDAKFELVFQLKRKGFSDEHIAFAKAALSNMIGGIGYFYGQSIISSPDLKEPVLFWPSALYTGVPSRSFFPRGFLWDEGFHQLLIHKWDPAITRDVIAHWLDLLNYQGWIPREQILGVEARRKVPEEFVVQHSVNANPPTFFLTLRSLIEWERSHDGQVLATTKNYLKAIFPRLKKWFDWYNTTQVGLEPGTYRWHGRDGQTDRELNPKTLTSGLDDYPRASHPSEVERHVDLRCWIALASGVLADIAESVGENPDSYRATSAYLSNNVLLDELHWSERLNAYADYGNHTRHVSLEWLPVLAQPNSKKKLVRVLRSRQPPSVTFVDAFGYVSLFPFLTKILDVASPKLGIILDDLRDPEKLWTEFGLRSLSKSAPLYNKYNTEHDKPYWRGPIWININYLAVNALRFYATIEGPFKVKAGKTYAELKAALVNNMFQQYEKTGFIYEQYDDVTGKGQGCYPFTGWSSLIALIMADL